MRTLLLLRGVMGSGKSTFIKENSLESYTLESDAFRLMLSAPALNENGEFYIDQRTNKDAWKLLYECLEKRMAHGQFTIIDATHADPKDTQKYKDLIENYKYNCYYMEFDISLEEAKRRNLARLEYKKVPESAIERAYKKIKNEPLQSKFKKISSLSQIENFFIADLNGVYKEVQVIGDIHGCYTVLKEALPKLKDDTLYVFLGDFLERGLENLEVFDFICSIKDKKNVILLEGNHERHFKTIGHDIQKERNGYFFRKCYPELIKGKDSKDIADFKKECRALYRKLRQAYLFKFGDRTYFCNHAGIPAVPKLVYISAKQMIDSRTENLGEIYDKNYKDGKCQNFTQIHGHQSVKDGEFSICLEGGVEGGGELRVAVITPNGLTKKAYKNSFYSDEIREWMLSFSNQSEFETDDEKVNELINSKFIKTKDVGRGLLSLGFTRDAFKKGVWNEQTIRARGLFVDSKSGEVKIRSYNKFFNIGEMPETTLKALESSLKFPVKAWKKYNGFLGIISVVDDELILATKSTISGDFREYFAKIWERESSEFKNSVFNASKKHNCSFIFEVCSLKDRHIVWYDSEFLVMLDAVKNTLDIGSTNLDAKFSHEVMSEIDFKSAVFTKQKELLASNKNFSEFGEFLRSLNTLRNIEGVVFEDENGFLVKLKCKDYQIWKNRRALVQKYAKNFDTKILDKAKGDKEFIEWLKAAKKEMFENLGDCDIASVRKKYEKD